MMTAEKTDKLLSIVIPAYNVELYIAECLDSIFRSVSAEKLPLVEILVVNDGSSDNTANVLREYGKSNAVVAVDQKNGGASNARNNGVRAATGEYVLFADSDDYFVPGSLDPIIDFILSNGDVDLIEYNHYEVKEGDKEPILKDRDSDIPSVTSGSGQEIYVLWEKASFSHYVVWTKVVKRELMIANHLYFHEGIVHEDEEWVPKIFAYAKKVVYLPVPVYVYRIRPGSVMSCRSRRYYFDLLKILDELYAFSLTPGFSKEYVEALRQRASSIFWSLIADIKPDQKYDDELIDHIMSREEIAQYSGSIHRRLFYRFFIKICGIKCFYFFKYSIKNSLKKQKPRSA